MRYLLDTNAWASYLNGRGSRIPQKLAQLQPRDIALCAVVKAELIFGAEKSSRRAANLALLVNLFGRFDSFDFDDRCADVYGKIRADLQRRGTPIGPMDLMIATTAIVNDCTVVTHNVREFSRVIGLKFEDWEGP